MYKIDGTTITLTKGDSFYCQPEPEAQGSQRQPTESMQTPQAYQAAR